MSQSGLSGTTPDPWGSFEPYAQLIRSLLPRATGAVVFDAGGELCWSGESTVGPDLNSLATEALAAARDDPEGSGLMRLLDNVPIYFFWLRDEHGQLIAMLGIPYRPNGGAEHDARGFPLVQSLLRPVLECLRRDFAARAAIGELNNKLSARDKDLELLLAYPADSSSGDTEDELKSLLKQALEHLHCTTAALIVPDKSIVLIAAEGSKAPDSQLVSRTHRQLLSMAQMKRQPVIINRIASKTSPAATLPFRIVSCPLPNAGGRATGVLALFREGNSEEFADRDARLGEILARKAAGIIETRYDAISGLYTRPAFEHRVRAVVASKQGQGSWTVLYIDSDQLHAINDSFGMHVGDTVIGQLGELVRRRLPSGAFAARISGDRFAALLPTALDEGAKFAESLREGAERLGASQGDSRIHVSISIGVAPLDAQAGELMHSLAAAETACKAAKDRGRNRVEVYQTNDVSLVRRFDDINIAATLREAISAGRLRLDAQLILPLGMRGEHSRPHYELLLRMIGEDGEIVGPDRFLSAANRYQLMPSIDRWVMDKAVALLQPHAELLATRAFTFAINFSGQSLNDDAFGDYLLARIETSGLDPQAFCFELTENATVANIGRAETLMRRLRRIGCGVALDDFGTGLSSLAYLRQLPVTLLKIDGSFVRDILKDVRCESMVRAIAQLARGMGIGTVAEYVETEEIRRSIATLGVDYAQGFAIGRPQPFTELLAELPLLAAASTVPRLADDAAPALRVVQGH